MTIWRRTLRFVGAITLVVGSTWATSAAQDGTVAFDPETSYVLPQQTFEVDIQVDEAMTGTHCYMVTVAFNRSLVELLSVTEGPWLQTHGETFFFWEDTGTAYDIGICLLGNGLYVDGPGLLATLTFQAQLSTGSTDLEFSAVDFTDVDLQPISVISQNGAISIAESCCLNRVGNANGLGGDEPSIGDVSVMIDARFITGTCEGILECLAEADVNQSGGLYPTCDNITIGDISTLIDYLFITGPTLGLADCL